MNERSFKILHAAETIRGGVSTVVKQLLVSQSGQASAWEARCLVPDDQASDLGSLPSGVLRTFRRSGRDAASIFRFGWMFGRVLWEEAPDLVHLHSSFAGAVGRLVVAVMWPWRRPRVVYCPHAFAFLMPTRRWKTVLYAAVERFLLPLTDAVICISRFEFDAAFRVRLRSSKLRIIENGVPPMKAGAIDPYVTGQVNALFVGRFDRQKGFDILLEAMRMLEDAPVHLTAVGGTVHDQSTFGPSKNVTYVGWLPVDSIGSYYAFADVLVVPSRWEGFGLVVVEAASLSVPALASDSCSFPELIVNGATGMLFSTGDPAEIARCLRSTTREQWREMGDGARRAYLERYTSARMVSATDLLYRELLA